MKLLFVIILSVFLVFSLVFATETDTKASNKSKTEMKTEIKTEVKTGTKAQSELENKLTTNAQSKSKIKSETGLKTETKTEVKTNLKSQGTKTNAKTESKSTTLKAKAKKSGRKGSIMSYLNLFKEDGKSKTSPSSYQNSNATDKMENWLMISSPIFKNKNKFPPVHLPNGKQIEIKTDANYFRINDAALHSKLAGCPPGDKFFWFRLSGSNLYYSPTSSDINILGAVAVTHIDSVTNIDSLFANGQNYACFTIKDIDSQHWKLCAENESIRNKWLCKLEAVLGQTLDKECGGKGKQSNENVIIVEKKLVQPMIIIPIPSPKCNENWNYMQNGLDWQCECKEGKEQSPIDFPSHEKAIDTSIKPIFMYDEVKPVTEEITLQGVVKQRQNLKIQLLNNSLRILHKNFGKIVTLDGAVYHAEEIIIHTPAEHTINGKKYDMEVQIVHYGQTKGDIGKQAVLSFLFEKKPGVYNKFLDDIDFLNLPNSLTKEVDLVNNLYIPKILYTSDDEDAPMMKPFSFYTYQGSLTSPPCTERTIMYVASKPLPIGTTALQLFREALRLPDSKGDISDPDWIPISNRLTQPLNGRPVFHYNHEKYCLPELKKSKKVVPLGHYEKVMKTSTDYFYVPGEKPSGLPGAFVVSEKEARKVDLKSA